MVDLIRESGVCSEWFQVFGMRFFDESDLSQVELGQSRRFQHGGSGPEVRSMMCPVRNHPPEHVNDICLWCDTLSMSCGNMPHSHNGRDGEAENC